MTAPRSVVGRSGERLELLPPPADPGAHDEAPAGEGVDGGELLGGDDRVPIRDHQHADRHAHAAGGGEEPGGERDGLEVRLLRAAREGAGLVVGVRLRRSRRQDDVVRDRDDRVAELVRRPGEPREHLDASERTAAREAPAEFETSPPTRCPPCFTATDPKPKSLGHARGEYPRRPREAASGAAPRDGGFRRRDRRSLQPCQATARRDSSMTSSVQSMSASVCASER